MRARCRRGCTWCASKRSGACSRAPSSSPGDTAPRHPCVRFCSRCFSSPSPARGLGAAPHRHRHHTRGRRLEGAHRRVDPLATSGINLALGEAELPPFPPSGVFEARFVPPGDSIAIGQGSYTNYRARTTNGPAARTHIRFQRAAGGTVTVEWSFPEGMSAVAQDLFGGVIVNQPMTTRTGSFTVTVTAVEALRLNVSYAARTAADRSDAARGARALGLAQPDPRNGDRHVHRRNARTGAGDAPRCPRTRARRPRRRASDAGSPPRSSSPARGVRPAPPPSPSSPTARGRASA